jgi:hypothetical protein
MGKGEAGKGQGSGRMGEDERNVLMGIGGCICGVALLISCIMCCVAVSICEKESFCINLNGNTFQMDSKLYTGGRHWIGAGHEMINFSRRQYILVMAKSYSTSSDEKDSSFYKRKSWNVNGRSRDGLKIELGYALHFVVGTTHEEGDNKILYNELVRIYKRFGGKDAWQSLVTRISLGAIKDTTTKYDAFDFFRVRN